MKLNDAILGLVVLLGGLAVILQAQSFQATHGQAYGPDLFPTIIGIGFVCSGIVLVIGGWRERQAVGWVDIEGVGFGRLLDATLVLAFVMAFILLAGWLGFVLSAGLGTWLLLVRFQGGKWLSSFAIAAALVLVTDWSFRTVLLVPLPLGTVLPRLPW